MKTLMTSNSPATATQPAATACDATCAKPTGDRKRSWFAALLLSEPDSTCMYFEMPDGEKI